jgi:hypothetical protein
MNSRATTDNAAPTGRIVVCGPDTPKVGERWQFKAACVVQAVDFDCLPYPWHANANPLECNRGPTPKQTPKLDLRVHPCLQLPPKFGQRCNQSSPDQNTFANPKSPPRPSLPPTLPITNNFNHHHHHQATTSKNKPSQASQIITTTQTAKMRTATLILSATASLLTTALAQDAYASGAPNVTMTTILPPANCTSACTTIVEPCSETATQISMGTGGMPPVTATGTYNMPSGPSATSGGEGGPPVYTGAAAGAVAVSGLLMAVAGLLLASV